MSSSASLVAYLNETDIYSNIKNMFKTCIVPFGISIVFYYVVSRIFPLHNSGNNINNEILKLFHINIFVLFPAFIVIVFSIFKVNVKISMIISIITAFILCIFEQHQTLINCIKIIILGYSLDKSSSLYTIIKGGGIISVLICL